MYFAPGRTGLASIAVLGLLSVGAVGTDAQVRERRLTEPDAKFPEAFATLSGVRTLPDGRLLVADALGQALTVVDLTAGTADTIGRVGGGPNEYRQPDGVFPLPGGKTLLVDLGNGRLTVLEPDLSFGESTPIVQGEPRPGAGPGGGMTLVLPRAVDDRGRVYFQAAMGGLGPGGQPNDSGPVLRWTREDNTIDTVGMVLLSGRTTASRGGSNNRNVMVLPIPLSPQDAWGVAPDGRLAFARADPYSFEWIDPDGSRVRGDQVGFRAVPVRQADKEEYVELLASSGLQVSVQVQNGVRSMGFSRGGGGRGAPSTDGYEWPDTKPAFTGNIVWVTPEGRAWVRRSSSAGEPIPFDVFGADGQIRERVILPSGRRILGFDDGFVYVAARDDLDLQWLERYRIAT